MIPLEIHGIDIRLHHDAPLACFSVTLNQKKMVAKFGLRNALMLSWMIGIRSFAANLTRRRSSMSSRLFLEVGVCQ